MINQRHVTIVMLCASLVWLLVLILWPWYSGLSSSLKLKQASKVAVPLLTDRVLLRDCCAGF